MTHTDDVVRLGEMILSEPERDDLVRHTERDDASQTHTEMNLSDRGRDGHVRHTQMILSDTQRGFFGLTIGGTPASEADNL